MAVAWFMNDGWEMEGADVGLSKSSIQHFTGGTQKNHGRPQPG